MSVASSALPRLLCAAGLCLPALPALAFCDYPDVSVRLVRAGFVDTCADAPCPTLRGEGVIVNACAEAVGVRVRLIARDRDEATVVIGELWPFGRRNVPPGEHAFTIDQWFGHDPAIASFAVEVTGLRHWP